MMNQDYLFVALVNNQLAVFRTTFKGETINAVMGAFPDIVPAVKSQIIATQSERYIVVTHDAHVIRRAMTNEQLFEGRAWVDLAQIAWPLVYADLISKRELPALAEWCSVECKVSTAREKVTTIAAVYAIMMRRFRTALVGESTLSDLGGETLESFRNMMRF